MPRDARFSGYKGNFISFFYTDGKGHVRLSVSEEWVNTLSL